VLDPFIDFGDKSVYPRALAGEAANGEAAVLLPAPDGTNIAVQVGGDFLRVSRP